VTRESLRTCGAVAQESPGSGCSGVIRRSRAGRGGGRAESPTVQMQEWNRLVHMPLTIRRRRRGSGGSSCGDEEKEEEAGDLLVQMGSRRGGRRPSVQMGGERQEFPSCACRTRGRRFSGAEEEAGGRLVEEAEGRSRPSPLLQPQRGGRCSRRGGAGGGRTWPLVQTQKERGEQDVPTLAQTQEKRQEAPSRAELQERRQAVSVCRSSSHRCSEGEEGDRGHRGWRDEEQKPLLAQNGRSQVSSERVSSGKCTVSTEAADGPGSHRAGKQVAVAAGLLTAAAPEPPEAAEAGDASKVPGPSGSRLFYRSRSLLRTLFPSRCRGPGCGYGSGGGPWRRSSGGPSSPSLRGGWAAAARGGEGRPAPGTGQPANSGA